jgi:putative glutamine amidotransferase
MQLLGHRWLTPLIEVSGHVRTRHQLSGEIQGEANSYHGLALADCPHDYRVLARSEDGGIEAIRHRQWPWEGWMWHPEREPAFDQRDLLRLRSLFAAAWGH